MDCLRCSFPIGPDVSGQAPPLRQPATPAPPVVLKGKLERLKVHGKSLAGNLMKESDSPEVSIYLPPSYLADRTRRFPVVYLLHGYTSTDLSYFGGNASACCMSRPIACSLPVPCAT